VAVLTEVGDGKNTLFWSERWLNEQRLQLLVPHLFNSIPGCARKRTVQEAPTDLRWVSDISCAGCLILAEH
jgi:hypothetical protein